MQVVPTNPNSTITHAFIFIIHDHITLFFVNDNIDLFNTYIELSNSHPLIES